MAVVFATTKNWAVPNPDCTYDEMHMQLRLSQTLCAQDTIKTESNNHGEAVRVQKEMHSFYSLLRIVLHVDFDGAALGSLQLIQCQVGVIQ